MKNIFLYCLLSLAFLLNSADAMGWNVPQAKGLGVAAVARYTVINVVGQVTLDSKQLKVGDRVSESQIPNIKVGKNSYFELRGSSGKQTLYGTQDNCASACAPVAKVIVIVRGPKKEILLGTQAEYDQIQTLFNPTILKKNDAPLNKQDAPLNKTQQLEKAKAPQKQMQKTKAKAGGG